MAVGFPTKANWAAGDVLTAAQMDDLAGTVNYLSPVGQANGSTLVANSANASGLGWNQNFAAGKNKIINGDFGIWQRGTSFTPSGETYVADRFYVNRDGTGTACTVSQQTFTAGTAPVSGYEGTYFLRYNQTNAGTSQTYAVLAQRIEDVRTFAGQTITVSFWAKAASGYTMNNVQVSQSFGSGGSTAVTTSGSSPVITTSWARYSMSITLPSIAGKTIGSGNYLAVYLYLPANTIFTVDFWGVQLEAGSTVTNFQTATGTLQGELAACQRYYWRSTGQEVFGRIAGQGIAVSTTSILFAPVLPVTMRTYPQSLDYSNLCVYDGVNAVNAISSAAIQSGSGSLNSTSLNLTTTGATQYRPYFFATNNNTAGYVGFSAEL